MKKLKNMQKSESGATQRNNEMNITLKYKISKWIHTKLLEDSQKVAIFMAIFSTIMFTLFGYLNDNLVNNVIRIVVYMIIMNAITFFYISIYKKNIVKKHMNQVILIAGYFISMFIIMFSLHLNTYNLFLLGPLMIALFVDINIGIVFTLYFTYIISLTRNMSIESFTSLFILGMIACLLSNHILEKKKAWYVGLILITTNITLITITKNFDYSNIINKDTFYSVCSTLLFFVVAYVVNLTYKNKVAIYHSLDLNHTTEEETMEFALASEHTVKTTDIIDMSNSLEIERKINEILEENYILVTKLQNYSEHLFSHSVKVAELSRKACVTIHADALLAKAGGLYHEIGHVISKDYINEGVKLAEDNGFPKEVIAIIKQHNSKFEKPTSKEAAIVMLSDSLISTIEYLKTKSEQVQIDKVKLVENIFRVRVSKGCLDESELTISDLNQLKECYIMNCEI